jgi:hypothetical protein
MLALAVKSSRDNPVPVPPARVSRTSQKKQERRERRERRRRARDEHYADFDYAISKED